jgi:hypothetical protein
MTGYSKRFIFHTIFFIISTHISNIIRCQKKRELLLWDGKHQLREEWQHHELPKLQNKQILGSKINVQDKQRHELLKLQNKQILGSKINVQDKQRHELLRHRNNVRLNVTMTAQGTQRCELPQLQNKLRLDVRMIEQDVQHPEQQPGNLWNEKRFNMIQQKAMIVIRSCLLD